MTRDRRRAGPDFHLEREVTGPVAGLDEVGRGPWAGPVLAAAVILDPDRLPAGLDDSKILSSRVREELAAEIKASARIGIGAASVREIEALNILQATFLAMRRALRRLSFRPALILVDGNRAPDFGIATRTVIGGDGRSLSIAAASIIAKVTRDRLMRRLALRYPAYGWDRNAGYGTLAHRQGLEAVGISPHHRKSYRPIRKFLNG
ncbi:MAG: ribonuclease HII [Alphaproteobacteria bacterium]|nr:ribonuclease HII [Alphaproteobacteria bacterium]